MLNRDRPRPFSRIDDAAKCDKIGGLIKKIPGKVTMRYLILSLALILSGCVSTQTVANRMGQKYIGTNFDDFVLKHGAPIRNFTLSTGEVVQIWHSGVSRVALGGTATTNNYGKTSTTTYIPGGEIEMYCEVQFKLDKENIIRQLTILKDTDGSWTTSMCHEIFDNSN